MNLLSLKDGNAFGYFDCDDDDEPMVAVKCKNFPAVSGELTALPLFGYYAMGNNCSVYPICKVEDYSNLMDIKLQKTLLKDVTSGTICFTGNQVNMVQKILVTDGMNISGRMVAPIGDPFLLSNVAEIEDLGYSGIYLNEDEIFDENKIFKRNTRFCPNCEEYSLYEIEDPLNEMDDVICKCANCHSVVKLCWF